MITMIRKRVSTKENSLSIVFWEREILEWLVTYELTMTSQCQIIAISGHNSREKSAIKKYFLSTIKAKNGKKYSALQMKERFVL